MEADTVCAAVCFARDLSSTPASEMTPVNYGVPCPGTGGKNVKVKVLGPVQIKKAGMNAILQVARGSREPAAFIILEYLGAGATDKNIVLVGKGITFDSGGISLKPADKMDEMKSDMSGGAAVFGVIKAASELRIPVNVIGLVPAAENLPGGGAYKPGDIVRSLAGLTIEIISTDAEGRLLLADALAYAGRYKPAALIDVATLTGACVVALGERVAGMIGTDEGLKNRIRKAAGKTGERVWELPMWDHYHELINSRFADLKNRGGRYGGAITAGAFLSRFAGPYPWVHLDIAGQPGLQRRRAICLKVLQAPG